MGRPKKEQGESEQFYRFNLRMPMEYRNYLQEMAWRSRASITDYLVRLIETDMEEHPEWAVRISIANLKG